jgi:hypothetical protein
MRDRAARRGFPLHAHILILFGILFFFLVLVSDVYDDALDWRP